MRSISTRKAARLAKVDANTTGGAPSAAGGFGRGKKAKEKGAVLPLALKEQDVFEDLNILRRVRCDVQLFIFQRLWVQEWEEQDILNLLILHLPNRGDNKNPLGYLQIF